MARSLMLCLLLVLALPVPARGAARLECPDAVGLGLPFQVRVVSDQALASVRLKWLDQAVDLAVFHTARGYEAVALLGAGLDDPPGDAVLQVDMAALDKPRRLERVVSVLARDFPEQRLEVEQGFVTPSRKALERHWAEQALVKEVLGTRTLAQYLKRPFVRPVPGEVSSGFGLRRVFNGESRNPHKGVDLRGRMGQPVQAFAAGRVALVGDHYFSGKCVYLDHGQGVLSMYVHLSRIDVRQGQLVAAGQVIGLVGATGRVTGPHLHFGLSVLGRLVDPLPLVE